MRGRPLAAAAFVLALCLMVLAIVSMRRSWQIAQLGTADLVIDSGGLLYTDRAGVPLLTGIPVLGDLFRNRLASGSWWFEVDLSAPRRVNVPLWFPALTLTAVAAWILWRSNHRPGCCPRCAYDLTGVRSSRCPECGTPN